MENMNKEEEKEAIKSLKKDFNRNIKECNYKYQYLNDLYKNRDIEIVLNLIDKLQEKIVQISEICIDESKCHISTKDAIEEIRRVI